MAHLFILDLTYLRPVEEVDLHIDAHRAFLQEHYDRGIFLASGRKVPAEGGLIIAACESREQAEEISTRDPFSQHGLAHYTITEFIPSRTAESLAAYKA